jgi:hypothetical protein
VKNDENDFYLFVGYFLKFDNPLPSHLANVGVHKQYISMRVLPMCNIVTGERGSVPTVSSKIVFRWAKKKV